MLCNSSMNFYAPFCVRNQKIIIIFGLVVCTVGLAQANEKSDKHVNSIIEEKDVASMNYLKTVNKDYDFAAFYKEKISLINNIAKKAGLKKYKLVSQQLAVNSSGFGRDTDVYEVSVSIGIEFAPDYKGINALIKESGALSIRISREKDKVGNDKK